MLLVEVARFRGQLRAVEELVAGPVGVTIDRASWAIIDYVTSGQLRSTIALKKVSSRMIKKMYCDLFFVWPS